MSAVAHAKPQSPVELYVRAHARERARERFPGFKAARIVDEVREAMVAGRISAQKPPGLRGRDYSEALYAWTADGVRVYVLSAKVERMVVMTTMRAHPAEETR